jgi:isoleucyl-tRNA synthetase
MPKVKEALVGIDGAVVAEALERDGVFRLDVDGQTVKLGVDDLEVRATAHAELVLVEEGGYAVALDTTVDDVLRLEGVARELDRAINDLRKARDLALADRIRVTVYADGLIGQAATRHGDWIAGEVLAVAWSVTPRAAVPDGAEVLDIDGAPLAVALDVV